jgi:putative CocE/NonD family hydrolase
MLTRIARLCSAIAGPGLLAAGLLAALTPAQASAQDTPITVPDSQKIRLRWAERIPLSDGTALNAAIYLPKEQAAPAPCVATLTPYTIQNYHTTGVYFAARGLPFVAVDVRGRGGSEGTFRPLIQEADDAAQVVEWLAAQPYCNGKVGLWGGSYAGYVQWGAASRRPAHLATITPAASPFVGLDFPGRANIRPTGTLLGGLLISGPTSQAAITADGAFWTGVFRDRFEAGEPSRTLSASLGDPARIPLPFAEWDAHPAIDAYWDRFVPTDAEFAAIDLPILSITGIYDSLQRGALEFRRRHLNLATPEARSRHYLVIGPWDHAGTRTPRATVGGLEVGAAGLVDLQRLQLDWYRWTMAAGPRPAFLKTPVAYYVMGADVWHHVDSLEDATAETRPLFLGSAGDADRLSGSGRLDSRPADGLPDHYVYDPRDVSGAALESQVDENSLVDQRLVLAGDGKQVVYHTAPFEQDTEVAGFFRLSAWIGIDQPDTDFRVSVYEITPSGDSILLTSDQKRARYRENERRESLVTTDDPLLYEFDGFAFVARRIAAGSRLRLVIAPINSMHWQKNYNSGGDVLDETFLEARTVTVAVWHDEGHRSTLAVPIGRPDTASAPSG